ncbi:MAG TPA: GxxExxY protein [Chitinophagaceae bacterium]|jgi:GxxExxY protein
MNKILDDHIEWPGNQIVDVAFQIHKTLGTGLLEKIYEACFAYELTKREIAFVTQKRGAIVYDNMTFEEGLRLDLLVDDLIIVEIKAQENYHPVWKDQLLSYLKLTGKSLGFIVNFTVPLIKDGIKRMILTTSDSLRLSGIKK